MVGKFSTSADRTDFIGIAMESYIHGGLLFLLSVFPGLFDSVADFRRKLKRNAVYGTVVAEIPSTALMLLACSEKVHCVKKAKIWALLLFWDGIKRQ